MTKLAVSGACGRMGRLITRLIIEGPDTELVCALDASGHPDLGKDAGLLAGAGEAGVAVTDSLAGDPDCVIDFSSPDAALARLEECESRGTAIVEGTTGTGDDFMERARAASAKIACVAAPNMSVGMNVLFATVGRVAKALGPGYDVEIVEAHHNKKKDSPSGTALKLAESVQKDAGMKDLVHGRDGMVGERGPGELGMHAVRGGDIVGWHTVLYAGPGETIEITHRVQSRETFAAGAVRAAVFAAGAPPGLYSMADVLEIGE
jgi:4-hydroxy-tetrahydrodipicolinate reductase